MISNELFALTNEGRKWAKRSLVSYSIAVALSIAALALFCVLVGILNSKPFLSLCGIVMYVVLVAYIIFELRHWEKINS